MTGRNFGQAGKFDQGAVWYCTFDPGEEGALKKRRIMLGQTDEQDETAIGYGIPSFDTPRKDSLQDHTEGNNRSTLSEPLDDAMEDIIEEETTQLMNDMRAEQLGTGIVQEPVPDEWIKQTKENVKKIVREDMAEERLQKDKKSNEGIETQTDSSKSKQQRKLLASKVQAQLADKKSASGFGAAQPEQTPNVSSQRPKKDEEPIGKKEQAAKDDEDDEDDEDRPIISTEYKARELGPE